MSQAKIPPQLLLPSMKYERIRNGSKGIVFRLSEKQAAKILYEGDCWKDCENFKIRDDNQAYSQLNHEYELNCDLRDFEVQTPRPMRLDELVLFPHSQKRYPAFIMEFLPFPSGADLGFHEIGIAEKLAINEIGKAVESGFIPGDDVRNSNNFLYNRKLKIIYLIDFGGWMLENKPESFDIANL